MEKEGYDVSYISNVDTHSDAAGLRRGKAFLYLLLLEMVCWIPGIVMMTTAINKYVAEEGDKLTDQIPPIAIHKGVAEVKADQPHVHRPVERPGDHLRPTAIRTSTTTSRWATVHHRQIAPTSTISMKSR